MLYYSLIFKEDSLAVITDSRVTIFLHWYTFLNLRYWQLKNLECFGKVDEFQLVIDSERPKRFNTIVVTIGKISEDISITTKQLFKYCLNSTKRRMNITLNIGND